MLAMRVTFSVRQCRNQHLVDHGMADVGWAQAMIISAHPTR